MLQHKKYSLPCPIVPALTTPVNARTPQRHLHSHCKPSPAPHFDKVCNVKSLPPYDDSKKYFYHSTSLFTIMDDEMELRNNFFYTSLPIPPPSPYQQCGKVLIFHTAGKGRKRQQWFYFSIFVSRKNEKLK